MTNFVFSFLIKNILLFSIKYIKISDKIQNLYNTDEIEKISHHKFQKS